MKDLYSNLGIDPKASREEVSAALEQKPGLSGLSAILQNEGKRAVYDRTHETLKTIGLLRHRLGLDSGDSWFLQTYPDFAPRARLAKSAVKPVELKSDAAAPRVDTELAKSRGVQSEAPAPTKQLVLIIAGISAVILLVLFMAYF